MTAPIERFKENYKNWRKNPFTGEDYSIDKAEDLIIPGSSPFLIQVLELPRKDAPSTVSVHCYDNKTNIDQDSGSGQKILYVASTAGFSIGNSVMINRGGAREEVRVIESIQAGISLTMTANLSYTHTAAQADDVERDLTFTEVSGSPAQSEFRVDYPPTDGQGTGLVEFNQNDNGKNVRVSYKGTGSPILAEYLDTKLSYPAGVPADNRILAFKSNGPEYRWNPIRYFHEDSVLYHASGENESCLLFRFKRSANEAVVLLELKGAKLHQGYYTELTDHNHGPGTLAISTAGAHSHSIADHLHGTGTLGIGNAGGHYHSAGSLSGSQPVHNHGGSTGDTSNNHTHDIDPEHKHAYGNPGTYWTGGMVAGSATTTGQSQNHHHGIPDGGNDGVSISGNTGSVGDHDHNISGSTAGSGVLTAASAGDHNHSLSGATASVGVTPKTYPDSLKVYFDNIDKTTEILAKCGMSKLGDGSSGHAFVTTGTGEMDISELITAAGIHELKITEPITDKGGRCLCHIESY